MRRYASWASPRYARRKVTRVSGWYRGRDRVQARRTCAGGLLKKGAAIRSPGRFLAVGHGLTAPPCGAGGIPALVFGVTTPTASPSLAASDARFVRGLTHPDAVRLFRFRVHTIDGALTFLRGPFSRIALMVLALRCWGLCTPPPSLKRAGG